jgi:MoaA/NifB/PqqE/SkfB family radical SAM enzyme
MDIAATQIRLEASSFCQLRCPSCPTTSRAIHPAVGSGFLRFEHFRVLLDGNPQLREIELANYGEIFLNPELLQIIKLAHERGVRLTAGVGANLNDVRDEVLEGLVKYQVRSMTCSIDGASQETYSQYRIRGNFDTVIKNIKKINQWKEKYKSPYPAMIWQFIVFGHNEHELPKARTMARSLDMNFFAKLNWDRNFSPIRDRDLVAHELGMSEITREEYKKKHNEDYMVSICHQLWESPQINWDGKVLGCCRNFWGDFGGNAFSDGLRESVNSETMNYARAMLQGQKPARDDIPCTTCEIYLGMRESERWLDRGRRLLREKALAKFRRLGVARPMSR